MVAPARTYLDHNATAPLRPTARAAMLAVMEAVGNPSSVHGEGRAARGLIEKAREAVAALTGGRPADVIFTSGGTEANALALAPGPATRLLVGATEHVCVLEGHRFPAEAVELIPVDGQGIADLDWLGRRLSALAAEGETALVALQLANNETGVVQPVRALADLVHAAGGVLHCDAVQAAGRIPVDLGDLGADSLAVSAHKLGGPQGVGALVTRPGLAVTRLLRGGGQERGWRAGTENVAGIAGFGAAARDALVVLQPEAARLAELRDRFEAGLRSAFPELVVFAEHAPRLPNTSLLALPGIPAEKALIALDLAGLALSSGAACSSGKVRRSHVLEAMAIDPDLASGALRTSLGWSTTENDVNLAVEVFANVVSALRERMGRRAA